MKEILMKKSGTVNIEDINDGSHVFSFDESGEPTGMITKCREPESKDYGRYMLRFPDGMGSAGYSDSVQACIRKSLQFGHIFKVSER